MYNTYASSFSYSYSHFTSQLLYPLQMIIKEFLSVKLDDNFVLVSTSEGKTSEYFGAIVTSSKG